MARKKIREYDSKRLLKAHILRLKGIKLPLNVAQVKFPAQDAGVVSPLWSLPALWAVDVAIN
jgi:hypothetical protein